MSWFSDSFSLNINDSVCPNKYQSGGIRINVITERLIRVEWQSEAKFLTLPTQAVLHRDLGKVKFSVARKNSMICVNTALARLIIDENTGELRQAKVQGGFCVTNEHEGNLLGTVRTLDTIKGETKLGEGIISKSGVAVLDDSDSLILEQDGSVKPKRFRGSDKYYFLYGHDYTGALADFYKISGATPLIPRFALSNWWSRYKAYTQDEYLELMRRFKKEQIPISVATVDMDWHWVDVKNKFGKKAVSFEKDRLNVKYLFEYAFNPGWTGYSWNTDLFPDYKAFLKELKDMGHKVTLNLHPAAGVQPFEDMYEEFADFIGTDSKKKKAIKFDMSSPEFLEGYFKILHHPYEKDGVDFWWIDWQQGENSSLKGLDPLWALNHYHTLDNERNGKRGLILSRFAGAGSHRYPLGFSGDTVMCWESLKFQPYFTATASNIGYSWWSHDIGGHMHGYNDDELYTRWVQFGVFSPIMRLHSSSNEFTGKEPWRYSSLAQRIVTEALRFRHRLLPYIYSENMRTHSEGKALIEPMYYRYPENEEAYEVKNQYFFGSELIAAPITERRNKTTLLAGAEVWLPEGRYTDIFTGRIYHGEGFKKMFRDMDSIPVLAKEGAIIPLLKNGRSNDVSNPEELEILIYRGNGEFTLYEDDGETLKYKDGCFAKTKLKLEEENNKLIFEISSPAPDISVLPERRTFLLSFKDITDAEQILVYVNGRRVKPQRIKNDFVQLEVSIRSSSKIKVILSALKTLGNPPVKEQLINLISRFQDTSFKKRALFSRLIKNGKLPPALPKHLLEPIEEILKD